MIDVSASGARHFVHLFGRPRVTRGDAELRLSDLETALSCLVYGSGKLGVSRATVSTLLWGADDGVCRHRLSQLLYATKHKTDAHFLCATGELLRPSTQGTCCDLERFAQHCDNGAVAQAYELLKLGLCDGLGTVGRNLEEWAEELALTLHGRLLQEADRCWIAAERSGRWQAAVEAAEVLYGLEPWNEAILRRLMIAHAMSGNPRRAEAAYRAHRDLIADSGETTDDETSHLLARIVGKASTSVSGGGSHRRVQEPPLCGRAEELRRLREQVVAGDKEGVTFIVLRGEGGIGKTRLISECTAEARIRGALVLASKAAELEREIPFNALLEALRSDDVERHVAQLAEPWRAVLLALMPELARDQSASLAVPPIQPEALQRRLFEALRQLLQSLTARSRVLLVLDDFHWADDTSIAALEYLRRRWEGGNLTLVFAFRPEEVRRDSTISRFLRGMPDWDTKLVLDLEELSDEAAGSVVQELCRERLPERDVCRLLELAGGNPFFLIELTLDYLAGRLELKSGVRGDLSVPFSIRTLIGRRLDGLSHGAARVLCSLAVCARPASLREIGWVSGTRKRLVIEALEELQRERLVRWSGGRAAPRHELIRQAVYRSLGDARRRWLHKRVALYLLKHRMPTPSEEVALHCYRAGDRARAFDFAWDAAEKGERAGAVMQAVHFLEIARRTASNDDEVARTVGRLARLRYLQLDFAEAGPLLQLAVEHYRAQRRTKDRLLAEAWRIDVLSRSQSMPLSEILTELQRIKREASTAGEWGVVAEVLDVEWHLLDRVGEESELARVLKEGEDCARHGDVRASCVAHRILGVLHQYYGDPDVALRQCGRALEISRAEHLEEDLLRNLNAQIVVYMHRGMLGTDEGMRVAEAAEALAARSGDLMFRYNVRANVGVWFLDTGEAAKAEPYFQECEKLIGDAEAYGARAGLYVNLGEVYYELRDIDRSRRYYAKLLELPSAPRQWFLVAMAHAGLGLSALYAGDLREVRKQEELLSRLDRGRPFCANDPSMILKFQAQLAHRRGNTRQAVKMLEETAALIRRRQVPNWIKLKLEAARLMAKESKEEARALAQEAYEVASALGLERRCEELRPFVTA